MPEITGSQMTAISIDNELDPSMPASITTYRKMRKDPTLALGRALSLAPIVAGEWGYEEKKDAPEGAIQFIEKVFEPLRDDFMEHAFLGGVDFGWQGFEKVFSLVNEQIVLAKLKPLLIDLTVILVDAATGVFVGFKQENLDASEVIVPLPQSLLVSFRVEGTDWRGQSLLENARSAYNQWIEANDGAARYDKKMAGSHWLIFFPVGTSSLNGVETDNSVLAAGYAKALRSSSILSIPLDYKNILSPEQEKLGWKIEMISDQGARQVSFVPRLEYLDKQKIRALHWPERAVLEGKFGTKAEAGVHQDLALAYAELQHQRITAIVNRDCVDQLLELNYGAEARGTVIIKAAPLVNAKLSFMQEVFMELLKDPENVTQIDDHALRSAVGVPESDQEKLLDDPGIDDVSRVERILAVR